MLKKILVVAALMAGASPAYADSFNVYVGYTDNLRASGFFPSPFCSGNNGTTCQVDTTDAGALDAGVFRIDNTGAGSLAITNLKVTFPFGPTFTLWNDVTLAPGTRGIFGQPTSAENFDTSDVDDFFSSIGIGINGIGGCTVTSDLTPTQQANCAAHAPIISFDENGNPVSLTDLGSILNTGGYDFVCCSADGNESINWNLIGQIGTRGGAVPEPVTLSVFGIGLAGAFVMRRRKKAKA